jgi:hypothetical protein
VHSSISALEQQGHHSHEALAAGDDEFEHVLRIARSCLTRRIFGLPGTSRQSNRSFAHATFMRIPCTKVASATPHTASYTTYQWQPPLHPTLTPQYLPVSRVIVLPSPSFSPSWSSPPSGIFISSIARGLRRNQTPWYPSGSRPAWHLPEAILTPLRPLARFRPPIPDSDRLLRTFVFPKSSCGESHSRLNGWELHLWLRVRGRNLTA